MHPAVKAFASQVTGIAAAFTLATAGALPPRPLALALAQGVGACAAAALLRSARWWLPIHLAFVPLAVAAVGWHVPPLAWLAAFALLLLVFGSSYRTQVPLYLSNRATVAAVAALLPRRAVRMLDLGSGTGSLVVGLARARADCRVVGIESSLAPHAIATWRVRALPNAEAKRGDFFAAAWAEYDVVYAFLSPVPMARVWRKAAEEMRPAGLLVSNSFAVPDVEPERVIDVGDARATRLYCYRPGRARSA